MSHIALVTGGAGFIGSHIGDALIKAGYRVAVVDNLSAGKRSSVNPAARFVWADVRDREAIRRIFDEEKPEVVFHEAAQNDSRNSMCQPAYDAEVNIVGMLNVLEAARAVGTRKIIYASSGGTIYGHVDTSRPTREDQHMTEPSSAYGISKLTAEYYLALYQAVYGIAWTALRYPNVFGPRQDGTAEAGVIARFIHRLLLGERPTIYGDGGQTRDYTFVDDVVRANLLAIERGDNMAINIGTGQPKSVREVYDAVESASNSGLQPIYADERPGDAKRVWMDISLAEGALGWKSEIAFTDGVQRTVEYYRQNQI